MMDSNKNDRSAMMQWCLAMLLGVTVAGLAQAQSVTLSGVSGSKALIAIGQQAPRFMAEGQSLAGVKLLKIQGQSATLQLDSATFVLKIGQTRADTNAAASATAANPTTTDNAAPVNSVQLKANAEGHFVASGMINGQAVNFLLDTGASTIAMSVKDATRLGIDYQKGKKAQARTANGTVDAFNVNLPQVAVEGLVIANVEASIVDTEFSNDSTMLLGMSFLSRVRMNFDANKVTLEKR